MSVSFPELTYTSRRERLVRESMFWGSLDRLVRNPQGLLGLVILGLLVGAAIFAPLLTWHEPNIQNASARFMPPSLEHPFGTDELRRDLYSRTLFGLRVSLALSLTSVTIGSTIGIMFGFFAGYVGGWVDAVMMRLIDALLAFPGLLSALAIVTILGPSIRNVAIAIAFFSVPSFARLSRAQMLAERNKDYVASAQALGAGPVRIVFRHIAPNAIAPLLTQVALFIASAVSVSAALSFLGLGERAPDASLGGLINTAKSNLQKAWWYPTFPGLALALLLLSLNLLADAVNDAINPFARRRA
ncbi:MAG: ABC transporter permease [Dehalococcoidia bacterium]|uniref:ABC transporter permease n=1 Tax=Candidatus Amarobacter glycogenicus TaxID=3140699 RepID=UPI002A142F7A|nr:ABC transporter permease [Dehalococcoidia bacterium]MBK6561340.1 ABC transporter permease [Dehalococcoidia bacterium]MBK8561097.1 ABC transporter permease [Dehalococcoidia bacterium]MBK9342992.1 ABC transporter permease [Dehalococcoidia bacterium]MBK9546171.1 ABC transporter permease [Dehalococcoidia bacterium]